VTFSDLEWGIHALFTHYMFAVATVVVHF